jgi:ABC-type spermidine/putrescine transport system permease subunit II
LAGLVSGVQGGAAYEQIIGRENLARTYWDALNFGILTAVAAMVIGSLASLVSGILRKSKGDSPA